MWHWSNFVVERSEEGGLSSRWQQSTPRCDLPRAVAGQHNRMSVSGRMLVVPVPQQLFLESGSPKPSSSCCSELCQLVLQKPMTGPVMYGPAREQPSLSCSEQIWQIWLRSSVGLGHAGAFFFLMIIIIITFLLGDNVIIYSQALCDPNDWCHLDMNWSG